MGEEPVGPLLHRGVVLGNLHRRHTDECLPGAVDVVHSPAAIPTAVGFLGLTEKAEGLFHIRVSGIGSPKGQRFEHAAGQVRRAGVNHRVVVGERHAAQELAVVIPVERSPAAVAVLHGEHPAKSAGGGSVECRVQSVE